MGLNSNACKIRNLTPPLPCARCGTETGYTICGTGRPARYTAIKQGFIGMVCHDCRGQLVEVDRVHVPLAAVPPCDLCGCDNPANYRRVSGASYSLEGTICLGCRDEIQAEQQAKAKRARVVKRVDDAEQTEVRVVSLKFERAAEERYRRVIARRVQIVRAVKIAEYAGLPLREAWKISRQREAQA